LSKENESAGAGPSGEKKREKRRKGLGRLGLHAGNVKRGEAGWLGRKFGFGPYSFRGEEILFHFLNLFIYYKLI
jgi:hypothetical protein